MGSKRALLARGIRPVSSGFPRTIELNSDPAQRLSRLDWTCILCQHKHKHQTQHRTHSLCCATDDKRSLFLVHILISISSSQLISSVQSIEDNPLTPIPSQPFDFQLRTQQDTYLHQQPRFPLVQRLERLSVLPRILSICIYANLE